MLNLSDSSENRFLLCQNRDFCGSTSKKTQQGLAMSKTNLRLNETKYSRQKSRILDAGDNIREENVRDVGQLGFTARALIMATLPHKDPKTSYYERVNGNYKLSILSAPNIGIPYGVMPRLIMIYLTKQCVLTKSREIELGDTLSEFMEYLGLIPTGGKTGTITALRKQLKRLLACRVSFNYSDNRTDKGMHVNVAKKYELFWEHKESSRRAIWNSNVTLSEEIYEEIIKHNVPIDMRAINALKSSSLAIDIYQWATWRVFNLKRPTLIKWQYLIDQFGSGYAQNKSGRYAFKKKFEAQLAKVRVVYPHLDAFPATDGLIVSPSPTHVSRRITPKKSVRKPVH